MYECLAGKFRERRVKGTGEPEEKRHATPRLPFNPQIMMTGRPPGMPRPEMMVSGMSWRLYIHSRDELVCNLRLPEWPPNPLVDLPPHSCAVFAEGFKEPAKTPVSSRQRHSLVSYMRAVLCHRRVGLENWKDRSGRLLLDFSPIASRRRRDQLLLHEVKDGAKELPRE